MYSKEHTPEAAAELKALEALSDDEIDTSDTAEVTDWSGARRGVFFRWHEKQSR